MGDVPMGDDAAGTRARVCVCVCVCVQLTFIVSDVG